MEKLSERKFIIGVLLFLLLLIYVGGIMTKGMNGYSDLSLKNKIILK